MYTVLRDHEGNKIGIIRDSDGAQIPIDQGNHDYQEFMRFKRDNPSHGLNLDDHDPGSVIAPIVDADIEAIKVKLAADDALTASEVQAALKKLLRA